MNKTNTKRRTAPRRGASRRRRSLTRPAFVLGVLAVAGLAGLAVLASLRPGGATQPSVRETEAVGHDVPGTQQGPDIHFAVRGVDFGVVPLNKEVGYAFSYANIGNETLRIDDVQVRVLEGC